MKPPARETSPRDWPGQRLEREAVLLHGTEHGCMLPDILPAQAAAPDR